MRNSIAFAGFFCVFAILSSNDLDAGSRRHCRRARNVCQPLCCQPVVVAQISCSADVEVYFQDSTICIKGKVGCSGKECRFDTCLGGGEATIDCGDLQVKLNPSGNQVCIKARVKIFGNWTPWADLGCYP
jgi:hypothetical protein